MFILVFFYFLVIVSDVFLRCELYVYFVVYLISGVDRFFWGRYLYLGYYQFVIVQFDIVIVWRYDIGQYLFVVLLENLIVFNQQQGLDIF